MLSKEYIPFIKLQLFLSYFSFCLPFEWDKSQRCLKVMEHDKKVYWTFLRIGLIFTGFKGFTMFYQLFKLYSEHEDGKNIPLYLKHQGVCFTVGVVCFLFMQIFNVQKRKEVCLLINSLMQFEKRHLKSLDERTNFMVKGLIAMGCVSSILCPFFIALIVLILPCTEPFFGSFVLECPDAKPESLKLLLIAGFEMWINLFEWTSGMWIVFMGFFNGIICIACYTEIINRNPFSNKMFETYREIQMLSIILNDVHQRGILPVIMFAALTTPSIAMFLCIGFHDELPLPVLGFMMLVTFDGLFVLLFYLFGYAGQIHSVSSSTLERWLHDKKTYGNKLSRRCLIALTPIKIKFGQTNFMEKSTCLACVQFSVNQAAGFLLAAKR